MSSTGTIFAMTPGATDLELLLAGLNCLSICGERKTRQTASIEIRVIGASGAASLPNKANFRHPESVVQDAKGETAKIKADGPFEARPPKTYCGTDLLREEIAGQCVVRIGLHGQYPDAFVDQDGPERVWIDYSGSRTCGYR